MLQLGLCILHSSYFVLVWVTICLGPEIMSKLAGESESNLRKGNSSNFDYNIAVQYCSIIRLRQLLPYNASQQSELNELCL